ncbi:MAG TPA: FG-GAP-like repeat-containing protein, partial [Acidobacteriaceae bacterium]
LLLTDENGHLWIALSTGPAQFAAPTQVAISVATKCRFSRADIGDINGDGKQDLVLAYPGDSSCSSGSTDSGVMSLLSNGDGTFAAKFSAVGSSAYLPKLIDFNGDGKLDLALSDVNSDEFAFDFFVIPGNGDGTFATGSAVRPLASGTAVTSIMAGDFDGDGKQDLTVGTLFREDEPFHFLPNTTGIETLAGKGDFTFGEPAMYAFGGYPFDGQYGDFNGDGKPDLAMNIGYDLFQKSPILSSFGYMVNQGDGTFGAFQPSVSTVYDTGGFFYAGDYNEYGTLSVGDFNGDGAIDVLSALDYDETFHYASQLYLNSGAVSFSLAANAGTVDQDSPITVTASVKATVGTKTPSGKVSFFDNGVQVAALDITSSDAVYVDSNPAVGAHLYTATYTGDANFNAATAKAAVNVVVNQLAPAFTLAKPASSSLSVLAGSSGTLQLSVNTNATFNGSIALSCSGAPSLAKCAIDPATLALGGNQNGAATLTITTQGTTTQKAAVDGAPKLLPGAGALSLATLLIVVWPSRMRRARRMWMVVILGAAAAFSMGMAGCGGGSSKQIPGTPTGSYTITITATSGSATQSQTVTLNVQ